MITDKQLDHMEQDAGSSDDTARLLAIIQEVRRLRQLENHLRGEWAISRNNEEHLEAELNGYKAVVDAAKAYTKRGPVALGAKARLSSALRALNQQEEG